MLFVLAGVPKKDKPKRSNFFKLPQNQNGAVDVDKQIRTEQMVLTIHDAFRAARKDFDIFSHQFAHEKPCSLHSEEDAKRVHSRYLHGMVRYLTVFAREIPQFTQLSMESQRLMIKSSILETAIIHSIAHTEKQNGEWIDTKMKFIMDLEETDTNKASGALGKVFNEMQSVISKIKSLNLTEVELSIISAMLLFCPDRQGLDNKYTLERMENELSLALKCQYLLNHEDGTKMFPKTVEIIVDLRAITTLYLDDILNAQVEVDD